jgi:hypothetical protein
MEDLRKLGRAYGFLVEYRPESVATPVVFRVRDDDKSHRTRTRYCQTKCGKVSRRQSERFDSTVEVGELEPYEESVEGSESSKHWLAFGQPVGGFVLCKQVNETRVNSTSTQMLIGYVRVIKVSRRSNVSKSRVRESRTHGSVGAPEE